MEDIFLKQFPTLDLHGYTYDMARVKTNDFVLENKELGNNKLLIIHGIGQGIVKEAVRDALKNNKNVISYKTDNFNHGCTIIELHKKN